VTVPFVTVPSVPGTFVTVTTGGLLQEQAFMLEAFPGYGTGITAIEENNRIGKTSSGLKTERCRGSDFSIDEVGPEVYTIIRTTGN